MSIESSGYICYTCRKLSELAMFNPKTIMKSKMHLCSARCLKIYQQCVVGRQKEADEMVVKVVIHGITKK